MVQGGAGKVGEVTVTKGVQEEDPVDDSDGSNASMYFRPACCSSNTGIASSTRKAEPNWQKNLGNPIIQSVGTATVLSPTTTSSENGVTQRIGFRMAQSLPLIIGERRIHLRTLLRRTGPAGLSSIRGFSPLFISRERGNPLGKLVASGLPCTARVRGSSNCLSRCFLSCAWRG